jgi:hypothetical protein
LSRWAAAREAERLGQPKELDEPVRRRPVG